VIAAAGFEAGGLDLSPQAIIVGLGSLATTVVLVRLVIRYERIFIKDQDDEIIALRAEYGAVRSELRVAQAETEECLRERREDRRKIDGLERTVIVLQSQVEALTVRVDRTEGDTE